MRGGEKFHIPAVKGKQPLRRGATPMPPQEPKLPTVEVVVVEPSTVEPSRVGDSAESPSTSARPAMAGVSESANEKELRSGTGWTTFIRLVISAIRQQAIPGIILICFEFLLLALYYWVPNTRVAYDWIAATKVKWGFGYVALSSSVFCGIIPWAYLFLSRKIRGKRMVLLQLLFYAIYWAEHGCESELVYQVQGKIWGNGTNAKTLVIKTCCDQFIVTPLWFLWKQSTVMLWKDCGFNFRRLKAALTRRYFKTQLPAVQVTSWLIWIPSAAIIYAMAAPLQIVMNNIIGCFWVLLLGVLSVRKPRVITAVDKPAEVDSGRKFEKWLAKHETKEVELDVLDLPEWKHLDRHPLHEMSQSLLSRGRASSF